MGWGGVAGAAPRQTPPQGRLVYTPAATTRPPPEVVTPWASRIATGRPHHPRASGGALRDESGRLERQGRVMGGAATSAAWPRGAPGPMCCPKEEPSGYTVSEPLTMPLTAPPCAWNRVHHQVHHKIQQLPCCVVVLHNLHPPSAASTGFDGVVPTAKSSLHRCETGSTPAGLPVPSARRRWSRGGGWTFASRHRRSGCTRACLQASMQALPLSAARLARWSPPRGRHPPASLPRASPPGHRALCSPPGPRG